MALRMLRECAVTVAKAMHHDLFHMPDMDFLAILELVAKVLLIAGSPERKEKMRCCATL